MDAQNNVLIGDVTIAPGLPIVIAGKFTIASLVEIDGRFVLTFNPNPFSLSVDVTASMKLGSLGSVAVAGGFVIDGNGMAALIDLTLNGNFGGAIGLQFNAHGKVAINTGTFSRTIAGQAVDPGFLLHVDGSVTFAGLATASGVIEISITNHAFTLYFNVSVALSGRTGEVLDPCAALMTPFDLRPGQEREVVFFLGEGESADEVRRLLHRYREPGRVHGCTCGSDPADPAHGVLL